MKFIVIVHAADLKNYEAGTIFDQPETAEQMQEMGKFNDRMNAAGIMLFAHGLKETAKGALIDFSKAGAKITEGPFTDTKNLVCGFWILQVSSKKEVLDWMKQAPMQPGDRLEIRQIEEFGE